MISITPFFHVYHKYVFIMININKIRLSGTTYSIQDENACKVVELTQAQYDELPTTAKTSNSLFVITDATAGDLSNYYTKTETDGLLDTKLDVTAYTPTDLSNYYTKSETSGATEISTALASKADTATTYTKTETDNAITAATSTKQDTLVSGTNIKTINSQSILGEGNIEIQGGGGSSYTAGDGIDITNDVISVTGKVDTSAYNTYTAATDTALASKQTTLTAGTGISIVDNVISATGGGGSGKAIEAGRGISITTGETADTVSFSLPISAGTGTNSVIFGDSKNQSNGPYAFAGGSTSSILKNEALGEASFAFGKNCSARGEYSHAEGFVAKAKGMGSHAEGFGTTTNDNYSHAEGYNTTAKGVASHAEGRYTKTNNLSEHASGQYNNSVSASTTFGDSGNTLFSLGNGESESTSHNAFEIRQNGDIYIADTNDTSTTNYYEKPMIKLQDALGGGGGSSYTAGDGIDITNDVISVTGKVDTSAITISVTSSSTDAQVPSAKAVYDMVGNINTILESI